jgi:hypothetical protein
MFFSTAPQREDDGEGIAEDAAHGADRGEAREGKEVVKSREDGHAAIVTRFAEQEKAKNPYETRGFTASDAKSYPH